MTPSGTPSGQTPSLMGSWPESPSRPPSSFCPMLRSWWEKPTWCTGLALFPLQLQQLLAAVYKVLGTFLFRVAMSQSLTDLAKYTIGHLHPNFLAICDPDWSQVNYSVYMQLESVCRESAVDVTEARLSFYSGHASFGMYCVVFLALYVQAQLCWKWAWQLRPTVQFFLVAFALYVGYTRVSGHKHHWSDVLAGLLQGAPVAGLTALFLSLPTWDPLFPPPAHARDPGACPAPA
ncbi:phospholipid phosphatase 2-like isoform X2 [Saimiri boliviensis]|uniref:phospholipid phosphatase 2-like isoform X2 n=1 Tax=Saimiri boliviensis TaxID=27679 RepID=UPI003D78718C